jgi:hypothetical protein
MDKKNRLPTLPYIETGEYAFRLTNGGSVSLGMLVNKVRADGEHRSNLAEQEVVKAELEALQKEYRKQRNVRETALFLFAYILSSIASGGFANLLGHAIGYGLGRVITRYGFKFRLADRRLMREISARQRRLEEIDQFTANTENARSCDRSIPFDLREFVMQLATIVDKHNAVIDHFNRGADQLRHALKHGRRYGRAIAEGLDSMRRRLRAERKQIIDALVSAEIASMNLVEQAIRGEGAGSLDLCDLRGKVQALCARVEENHRIDDEVRQDFLAGEVVRQLATAKK